MSTDAGLRSLKDKMKIEPAKLSSSLEDFIRGYTERLEREGAILGLSGGLDSAVVAALCKKALGQEKTLALIMPEKDSKKEHIEDALGFARKLGIQAKLIDITPYLKRLGVYRLFPLNKFPLTKQTKETLVKKAYGFYERRAGESPFSAALLGFKGKPSFLKKANAYYRIKHRLRMMLLYLYAELENRLVIGAANKSESRIGFFVKHGCDDAADVMPLLSLYKTQVRELARYLGIPLKIIEKAPSPDIIPGISDEQAVGISYEVLDLTLLALELGWKGSEIASTLGIEEKDVSYVRGMIQRSEHMRETYVPESDLL